MDLFRAKGTHKLMLSLDSLIWAITESFHLILWNNHGVVIGMGLTHRIKNTKHFAKYSLGSFKKNAALGFTLYNPLSNIPP